MKKLLAAVLAAMFLFTTAAFAESAAQPQDRYLLIRFSTFLSVPFFICFIVPRLPLQIRRFPPAF